MLVTAGKLDYVVASEERRHVQVRVVALVLYVLPSWGTGALGRARANFWFFLGIEGF